MTSQQVNWNQCLQHAALTDIGMKRANNQDAFAVVLASDVQNWYARGHVFIVADGMGAHAAGELASKLAVDGIPHLYHKHHELSPPEAMQKAILETNAEVHRRGEANPDFQHMGTTSSVLVLLPQGALIAHIGDSRIYRLRGDTLRQLTFDHSLVWEMKASGQLPAGVDAASVAPKNVITRSLGPNAKVKVDFEGPYPVQVGDTFLLCSDGLTGRVSDEEIAVILAHLPPKEAAPALVDLANLRGGPDNITLIIVKITDPQITTAVAQAEPLVLGAVLEREKTVHPALWVTIGVLFLAAIVMIVLDYQAMGLAAACAGILAATVGILQRFGSLDFFGSREVSLAGGRRLGGGPYSETKLVTGPPLAEMVRDIVEKLHEGLQQRGNDLDWTAIDRHAHQAVAACRADATKALRHFAAALHEMALQIRQRQKAATSDSGAELF